MKTINTYINEKLVIGNNLEGYKYHPKTKNALINCIKKMIEKEGLGTKDKPLDLNDIDISEITDMSSLFDAYDGKLTDLSENGYFDISYWNVSNVKNMRCMFYESNFNGDISDWDVSNVKNMNQMFSGSSFDGDISYWDVSKVTNMYSMFSFSKFTGKNGNLDNWNVKNLKNPRNMFYDCPLQNNPPKWWYKV